MIRLADYIIQRLYQESCRHIFTVTGRGILYLTDALARHGDIQSICVHHEQAAAYAAMAYSQVNETMGACLVSTGCAATNTMTGVLCAWQDNIPFIVISGQNKLNETVNYTKLPIRTYGQQEADVVSLVSPITKYAVMITDPNDIGFELEKAIYLARSGRQGPVWLDIPLDVQNMRVDETKLRIFTPPQEVGTSTLSKDIAGVVERLTKAKRPLILIGSGVRSAQAIEKLHAFLKNTPLPVVYTNSASDILNREEVLSIGCVGAMASNRAANFAVQNSDCLLVLGSRLTTMITGEDISKFAREATVIAVDIDPYEHKKHPELIDQFIQADLNKFLTELQPFKLDLNINTWIDKCHHWNTTFPKVEDSFLLSHEVDLYHLAKSLTKVLAEDAICVCDAGLQELIIPTTVEFMPPQRCLHPVSQGAMGYALPAAIGAICSSNRQVVAVIGDGSIMMNLQELQTVYHNGFPLKLLVINNNCYAVIRKRQKDLFRSRTIGTDTDNGVSCPDFKKIAGSFNIRYEKIETSNDLDGELERIVQSDEAILCEVMGKADQGYIHTSYRRTDRGRFVRPPIEDQSPFLSRDIFLSEMIIDPVDQ